MSVRLFLKKLKNLPIISIIFILYFALNSEAKGEDSITGNLVNGFVQYQAGRIENIALESLIDKVRYDLSFKTLFPLTSQAMRDFNGVSSKRLIPLMQHYIKQDIDNFRLFNQCIAKKLYNSDYKNNYSNIYSNTKEHFSKGENSTILTFLEKKENKCDKEFNKKNANEDKGKYEIYLEKIENNLKSFSEENIDTIISGITTSWFNKIYSNENKNEIIKKITNLEIKNLSSFEKKFIDLLKSCNSYGINKCENYYKWLIKNVDLEDKFDDKNIAKIIINNEKAFNFFNDKIKKIDNIKSQYDSGSIVLNLILNNGSLIPIREACLRSSNKSRTCQLATLSLDMKRFINIAKASESNTLKVHRFLMLIKTFDIEQTTENDISGFRSRVIFLANLLDAATPNSKGESSKDSEKSTAVANVINSYIDEEQVYLNKQNRKFCEYNFGKNQFKSCWNKNSFFITSYFGLNSVWGEDKGSELDTSARIFGPVGFEYKFSSSDIGSFGINYSPFDLGSAISNELQSNNFDNDLSAISTPSVFITWSLRQAPVTFLGGRQFGVSDISGKETKVYFLGISFDLPLATLY